MKKVEELNYYELLNVEPSATQGEIEKAYLLSVATFRPDGFATYSVLTEVERENNLRRAELAFEVLGDPARRRTYDKFLRQTPSGQLPPSLVERSRPSVKPEVADPPVGIWMRLKSCLGRKDEHQDGAVTEEAAPSPAPSLSEGYMLSRGQYLRSVRMSRGLTLEAIANSTRINIVYLRALEEEEYDQLPSGNYLHFILAAYAKSLKLNPDRIVKDFKSGQKG